MALRIASAPVAPEAKGTCGLSLVMIARNAAKTIKAALDSVADVCEQRVVYLAGESTDDTSAIAEACGATVIQGDWRNDFAWARNQAQRHASGRWVLVMDADETLHPDDVPALQRAIQGLPHLYSLTMVNDMGPGVDPVEHYSLRLFPNHECMTWRNALHETVVDTSGELGGSHLAVRLLHTGYTADAMSEQRKYERNLSIALEMAEQEPSNPLYRLFVAQTFQLDGQHMAAIDQFRVCLHLCGLYETTPDTVKLYGQAAMGVVGSLNHLGRHTEAAAEGEAASKVQTIRHPGFWLVLGNAYNAMGMGPDAVQALEKAVRYRENRDIYQVDTGVMTWKPYAGLGYALHLCGRNEESRINLQTALNLGAQEPQRSAIIESLQSFPS